MPGDVRQPFAHGNDARQVLNDAEQELQMWQPNLEDVQKSNALGANLMPNEGASTVAASEVGDHHEMRGRPTETETTTEGEVPSLQQHAGQGGHLEAAT